MFLALSPMLATTNGAMWMLSTPNGSRGMYRKMWKDGGPEWERFEVPAVTATFTPDSRLILAPRLHWCLRRSPPRRSQDLGSGQLR